MIDTVQSWEGDRIVSTVKAPGDIKDGYARELKTLLRTTNVWANIRNTMPLQYVRAFLLVAEEEGLSVLDYAERAGVGVTVMSRHLHDIGDRNRHKEPGFGLVSQRVNLLDNRKQEVRLTPRGRALARQLADIMREG